MRDGHRDRLHPDHAVHVEELDEIDDRLCEAAPLEIGLRAVEEEEGGAIRLVVHERERDLGGHRRRCS